MRSDMPGDRRGSFGHAHFWERALSRRGLVKAAAGASSLLVGSRLLTPSLARAAAHASSDPKPIPEFFDDSPFHVLSPASAEPSSITDLNGFVGATEIQGTGTGGLLFDVDMRFMQGVYVGMDGRVHRDTFGFV
jgi:hypothetical protein